MHRSRNQDNFRNDDYLNEMAKEYRRMCRAYHKYISYRNKLLKELYLNNEQISDLNSIDIKFCKQIERSRKRIEKEDFMNVF